MKVIATKHYNKYSVQVTAEMDSQEDYPQIYGIKLKPNTEDYHIDITDIFEGSTDEAITEIFGIDFCQAYIETQNEKLEYGK